MFRQMPVILIALICAIILFHSYIPLPFQQVLYAISLSIKSCIIFILPFIIFGLLFKAALNLSSKATGIIGLILGGVCISSFIATFLSHYIGEWTYHLDLSLISPDSFGLTQLSLQPAWLFSLPPLIGNDKAMFAGLGLGILCGFFKVSFASQISDFFDRAISALLKIITLFIPLFVAGFVIKLQHDNVLQVIFQDYALIFMMIALCQFFYILILYFVVNGGNMRAFLGNIKDMFPAALSGFCTMSSAATMPLTIVGAENNVRNKNLVESIIPATVNVHLIGDCFAIPILAYAVLKNYGQPEPLFVNYLIFTLYFVLAKFSVAAIPGGGILVMLPILEKYMGFNGDMMSLITALYILFDPVITSANVLGNGAFAKIIDHVVTFSQRRKSQAR